MKKYLAGILLSACCFCFGDDTLSVNLMGGGNLSALLVNTTSANTYNIEPGFGFDTAASLGLMISQRWEIELGVWYLSRTLNDNGLSAKYTEHFIEVPLTARYYISEAFSVNAGVYSGFGVGSVSETVSGTTQSLSYDAAGFDAFEFGTQLGLRLQHYVTDSIAPFIESRYDVGIQRIASGDSRVSYSLHLLLGLQIGF